MMNCLLCSIKDGTPAVAQYYRDIMVYVLAAFCLIQLIILLISWPQKFGHLRKQFGTS